MKKSRAPEAHDACRTAQATATNHIGKEKLFFICRILQEGRILCLCSLVGVLRSSWVFACVRHYYVGLLAWTAQSQSLFPHLNGSPNSYIHLPTMSEYVHLSIHSYIYIYTAMFASLPALHQEFACIWLCLWLCLHSPYYNLYNVLSFIPHSSSHGWTPPPMHGLRTTIYPYPDTCRIWGCSPSYTCLRGSCVTISHSAMYAVGFVRWYVPTASYEIEYVYIWLCLHTCMHT